MSFGRGGGSGPGRGGVGRGGRVGGGGPHGAESGGRGWGRARDSDKSNWACPSCQNTNWSWRTNCNMCGSPKPSSLLVRKCIFHELF
jgi:RNA-binding protein FUS